MIFQKRAKKNSDLEFHIEKQKTHLHFCKRYLEVSNKASNAACRGELGRFPLIVSINEKNS